MCIDVYPPEMTAAEVLKKLRADGWAVVAKSGAHLQLKHPSKPGRVTLSMHGKRDIKLGTLRSIERQADLRLRD